MRPGRSNNAEQEWRDQPQHYTARPLLKRAQPASNWTSYACAVALGVAIACVLAQWGVQ